MRQRYAYGSNIAAVRCGWDVKIKEQWRIKNCNLQSAAVLWLRHSFARAFSGDSVMLSEAKHLYAWKLERIYLSVIARRQPKQATVPSVQRRLISSLTLAMIQVHIIASKQRASTATNRRETQSSYLRSSRRKSLRSAGVAMSSPAAMMSRIPHVVGRFGRLSPSMIPKAMLKRIRE